MGYQISEACQLRRALGCSPLKETPWSAPFRARHGFDTRWRRHRFVHLKRVDNALPHTFEGVRSIE